MGAMGAQGPAGEAGAPAATLMGQDSTTTNTSSLTIKGLALDVDEHYTLVTKLVNPLSANFAYELYFGANGQPADTTPTDYYSTRLQVLGSGTAPGSYNDSVIFFAGGNSNHVMRLHIEKSPSGRVVAYGQGGLEGMPFSVSTVQLWSTFIASSTTTGLSSLTVQSATANGIGAGSSITVYKD
jgi:hypothetical protein